MLDELAAFLEVVRTGTFTAAARRVHLSQPALSAAIARLEDQLGARLLDRGPAGAKPTAAGRALVPHAERALAEVARGKRAVAEVEGLVAGEVRVLGGATACAEFLPPVLVRFHRAHPGVLLSVREAHAERIRERVDAGEADLGVVPEGGEPWRTDELVLVVAPGLEGRAASLPHVALPPGSDHRRHLDRLFPEARIAIELSGLGALRAHVAAGMGIGLLSRAAVARDLRARRLVVVPHPGTPVPRSLELYHRGALSPAAAALRALLLEPARSRKSHPHHG